MSIPPASFPPARPATADRPAASSAARSNPPAAQPPAAQAQTPAAQPRGNTPSAGQALRALLNQRDDHILPALRALPAVDFARLHDLFSQTVFNALVREHTADQSDPPAPVPFLTPDTPPGDRNPGTPPDGTPNVRPGDTASVFIEHDIDEGQYFWREVSPPLSARRGRNGAWTSQEGWVIRPSLPDTAQTIDRPEWWPYPEMFALSRRAAYVGRAPTARTAVGTSARPRVLHIFVLVPPSVRLLLRPLPPSDSPIWSGWPRRSPIGERRGHPDHKCYNCLRAHAD